MSHRRIWSLLLAITLAAVATNQAQSVRSVYAIKDAKIYPVSGPVIARGTIVIRNGLIEAVGANVQPPAEATVIEGNGLVVYPGLIDSFTDTGLPEPVAGAQTAGQRGGGQRGGPQQRAPQNAHEAIFQTPLGLNPDHNVTADLQPNGKNVEASRNAGITSAFTVARNGILTGQGALINTGSTNPIVKASVAMNINPVPQPGGYPGTPIGVFAVIRQAFSDANWYRQSWTQFNANPKGIERPKYDAALEAMAPMIDGKLPTIVQANWRQEVKRAVSLADELKIKPIIAGGLEAGPVASLLKSKDIPVLVSVNYALPKPGKDEGYYAQELKDLQGNVSLLQKAGVRYALQSGFADRPQLFIDNIRKTIEYGLTADQALRAATLSAAEIFGVGNALGSLEPGKIANIVVASADPFTPNSRVRQVFIDGVPYEPTPPQTTANQQQAPPAPKVIQRPGSYFNQSPNEVLIRNATVLTITKGTIKNGSVLIRDGKIAAVGTNLTASPQAKVIDATGKYVMPGIIDAHSHMAAGGGINEGSSPVTPQVRMIDFVDDEDVAIYRALAGGTTLVNQLHGSANVIGGTSAVFKLKWGKPAEEMLFGAPAGIKFALGENPKRSNSNQPQDNRRWPATRMGVEETLRESFTEARRYMKDWEDYEAAKARGQNVVSPRRDLKLETLADILRGKIRVNVHCYVSPEIVMMLNVADEYGFKISVLQHVLEGYKVAKEIAAHGATASTFADMWGYKWEAWDAIPQNAGIMTKFGVNVSINSDSDERVRRLYQEAARALHYMKPGEITDDEALKWITINPAIQLGIENRVGSLDVGKDADIAIFSEHPLSSYTVVEMTMIEGQIYFDRAEDLKNRPQGASQQ